MINFHLFLKSDEWTVLRHLIRKEKSFPVCYSKLWLRSRKEHCFFPLDCVLVHCWVGTQHFVGSPNWVNCLMPRACQMLIPAFTNVFFRYLNRVARHPILREDPDFRQFLEADSVHTRSSFLFESFRIFNFVKYDVLSHVTLCAFIVLDNMFCYMPLFVIILWRFVTCHSLCIHCIHTRNNINMVFCCMPLTVHSLCNKSVCCTIAKLIVWFYFQGCKLFLVLPYVIVPFFSLYFSCQEQKTLQH